jgi:ribosome-associated translation inhibitor RaiA
MERPLEIAFHNMEPSPELEADIRSHVDRLSKLYDRLTGCTVTVEGGAHPEHRVGDLYRVHIVMSVPGGHDLVVTHEPHRVREHYAHPDAEAGIRSAFHAAERQLKDFKGKRRTEAGLRD